MKTVNNSVAQTALFSRIGEALLGFGSFLFCYLFYRARYIPRFLAAFGMLAFAIGLWLMIKGVNTRFNTTNK